MAENKLQLNDQKTEFLIICAPWKRDCVQFDEMEIGDARISSTTDARNLGVIMDKSLNMEKHIQKLCQTSIAQLRDIADVRKYLTQNAAEKLIHAFITSRLDYCNLLLYGPPSSSLKKLQKVQNMAAKILTLRRKYEHITPILQELHWLPVEHRITYKILPTTHRALNCKAPQYITDLLPPYIPARNLRSEGEGYLVVRKTHTKTFGERSFRCCCRMGQIAEEVARKQYPQ